MKNPTIAIHNVFIDERTHTPSVRYTVTIPRENGSSLIHGSEPIDQPIEIPINDEEE